MQCVQCETDCHSQTPTFDGVLSSASCLTHVSGELCLDSSDCSDRIGFTLSRSSSFSFSGIFTALTFAALRNSILSGEHNQVLREDLTFAEQHFSQLRSLPPSAINTITLNTIPLFYPINLPSKLKLTECVEALDFERLLLALDEERDDLYLKLLTSLPCLVWRLDLERDLYCL